MTDMGEQITKYLTDVHSIELQAIEQMRIAPKIAGDPELSRIYDEHLTESREHERLVSEQLERRGAGASTVKDVAGRVGGWGMALFAKVNPDTTGKLAAHSYSYEHMELAAYELLRRIAERGGDEGVRAMAERIGGDERAMADRIAERWDRAVEASLREKGADELRKELTNYLRDAHALEAQALQLLESGPAVAAFEPLAQAFRDHLDETRDHQRRVDERLRELGSGPARFQGAALRVGAMNIGGFFKLQPDTPVKLAGFAYAFEALEAGGYELLMRVAQRAGDDETVALAEANLADEHRQADRIAATWDAAVDHTLAERVG